uniref:SWIM-type domain-containing protein n=1 Tax=Setaria italica TaxID=4555 RepID=K4AI81_SETIT
MNLASDSNWKHYKDVVHEANVACLEVIVEIVRMPGPNVVLREEVVVVNRNGTQESEMLHHMLGETECAFDLAIANDDFPNNIFERDEANIDDDNVFMGSKNSEFKEDGVVERDVELPSVPNDKDISMVHKAICESSMVNSEGMPFGESPVIKKGMKFNSLEKLKVFLADYAVRLHRPFSVVHSDKNLRYNVMCKQGCHWRESYSMIPRVLTAIAYYNPKIKWFIDSCGMMHPDNGVFKHILQRVFWCFPQCSEAFQHYRHVILVDGTFLTGKYKGTLMMAVGVDPEQQLVPLAFALAESENNENWSWFMKLVRRHVFGPSRLVCMISDRHHGLLNCAKDHMDGFPPLVHRWCTRHFAANMSHRQKSDRVIGKLKTLCKVHTEREFSEKLEDLVKDLNDDAKEWLKGMRWGIMTTNYSESLNAVFKGIQSRPVSGIIEYSFEKCNAYFVDRWQKARAMLDEGHRIGKVADEYLSQAELRSVHHLAEPYGPKRMVYSIRSCGSTNVGGESHGFQHYRVDLNEVLCTCNVPQLLHLPCSHFITACKARGLNYESPLYMSLLYSREHWESSFQPYLDSSQWPAYEGVGISPVVRRVSLGLLERSTLCFIAIHQDSIRDGITSTTLHFYIHIKGTSYCKT